MPGAVLTDREEAFIREVLSDVDLALEGAVELLEAQAIAAELEELPLPYLTPRSSFPRASRRPVPPRPPSPPSSAAAVPPPAPRRDRSIDRGSP